MFYKLTFIRKNENLLCGADFNLRRKETTINLNFILSLSDVAMFHLPLSGKEVGEYAVLTMSNNDTYCVSKTEYSKLMGEINKRNNV